MISFDRFHRTSILEITKMAQTVVPTIDTRPSVLTPDHAFTLFDQESCRITGMPGERFLERFDAGELQGNDDTPEGRELMYLIALIPFGRQDT